MIKFQKKRTILYSICIVNLTVSLKIINNNTNIIKNFIREIAHSVPVEESTIFFGELQDLVL